MLMQVSTRVATVVMGDLMRRCVVASLVLGGSVVVLVVLVVLVVVMALLVVSWTWAWGLLLSGLTVLTKIHLEQDAGMKAVCSGEYLWLVRGVQVGSSCTVLQTEISERRRNPVGHVQVMSLDLL